MSLDNAARIPPGSPLATGWRADAVRWLDRHGINEMLDLLAAYAELRCRQEPDDCSAAAEAEAGTWYRIAEPAVRRIVTTEEPRGPGRPRLDGTTPPPKCQRHLQQKGLRRR
jgi:hypothetical protein